MRVQGVARLPPQRLAACRYQRSNSSILSIFVRAQHSHVAWTKHREREREGRRKDGCVTLTQTHRHTMHARKQTRTQTPWDTNRIKGTSTVTQIPSRPPSLPSPSTSIPFALPLPPVACALFSADLPSACLRPPQPLRSQHASATAASISCAPSACSLRAACAVWMQQQPPLDKCCSSSELPAPSCPYP